MYDTNRDIFPKMEKYLTKINFKLLRKDEHSCEYTNNKGWIVQYERDRYYDNIFMWIIPPGKYNDHRFHCRLVYIVKASGKRNPPHIPDIEEKLQFIVDNADYVFDESLPYKEECDKGNGL